MKMPKWFWKAVGWFVAITIVVVVGKSLINNPVGSAAIVKGIARDASNVFKFFGSL
jgi:hypothetical protein